MTDHSFVNFPPEWVEQSVVLLAWPYADGDFSPWLAEVEKAYGEIALEISQRQKLVIACQDKQHKLAVLSQLFGLRANLAAIHLIELPFDDIWVRDTAPLTVHTSQGLKYLDFRFNGWGNKYPHSNDAKLAQTVYDSGILGLAHPLEKHDFVLEGGSLETDGAGTLMTTARCLLNPNRNPDFKPNQIEQKLKETLGIKRILWLHHGHAEGDDTDAHIDTLARFCSEDTIAYTACDDPKDALFDDLKAMEAEIKAFRTAHKRPYQLIPLPIPKPIFSDEGQRLPATYANFLIINGAVLVPVYGDAADEIALERLGQCFKDRTIVPIQSKPLIQQYGSIHCMTMQFPKEIKP